MSSTNRGIKRISHDLYETPPFVCNRLLEAVPLPPGRWLEPCAGSGNIIRAVNARDLNVEWSGCEIRPETQDVLAPLCPGGLHIFDFLALPEDDFGGKFDVALTNPPYSLAQEFIEKCMRMSRQTVMLLRLNFLESETRCEFMRRYPPDVFVLPNRPIFSINKHGKPGSDSTAYGWFRWWDYESYDRVPPGERRGTVQVLNQTPLAERKAWNQRLRELAA